MSRSKSNSDGWDMIFDTLILEMDPPPTKYIKDAIIVTKNGKSDQLTIKIDNKYICDADKDGSTTKSTITAIFTPDSVRVIEMIPADTFHFSRNVYAAKRN